MDRRTTNEITAANVRDAISTSGISEDDVAKATGLTMLQFRSRMNGATDFTVTELVTIGGLSCFSPADLLRGAA